MSLFLTVANVLCIFLKPGLGISCKNRKHMFADTFLLSFLRMPWSSHSCNDHRYSYFIRNVVIDMLTVLKSFLEHDCKHVLRLSRLFSMETRLISCRLYIICHLDISVESIERFICRQDQGNEEPLFIRPQFDSQFGMLHLLGFIKPMQQFDLNVFLCTSFKLLC